MNKQIWLLASLQAARAQLADKTLKLSVTEWYALRDEVSGCLIELRQMHTVAPVNQSSEHRK
jgi:hypothetical protein